MNVTLQHMVAGAAGGLAAGLLLSGVIAGMGASQGRASELVTLERRALGRPERPDRSGTFSEEALAHGGHLALSAIAGAGYGAVHRSEGSSLAAGLAFGLGFWAVAYGAVGPALGVTPKPWRDEPLSLAQHGLLHAAFGVATALVAERVSRRL